MKLFQKAKPEAPLRRRLHRDETDAQRPQAFSYYAGRSSRRQNIGRSEPGLHDDVVGSTKASARRSATLQRIRALILLLTIFGLGAYCLSLSSNPRIVVTNSDAGIAGFVHESAAYQMTAHKILAGSMLNSNKVTVDTMRLQTGMQQQYPEIKQVSLGLPLFARRPTIYIEPYKPACILTTKQGGAYIIDVTGRALSTVSQVPSIASLKLPTVIDQSGTAVILGKPAVPSSTVSFITAVSSALTAARIPYGVMNLPSAARQLETPIAGSPYYVKFNLQSESRQQIGTFLAVKKRLTGDKVVPAEYIDVRVAGRAYYK